MTSDFIIKNGKLERYTGSEECVTVPEEVTIIGPFAFHGSGVKKVILGENVKTMETLAFAELRTLEEVVLPDNMTSIDHSIFRGCWNLKKINMPSALKSIGESAFEECYSLEEVEIPDGVEEISGYAFRRCTSLKSVKLPASIKRLGYESDVAYGAFAGCSALENVDFPKFLDYTFNFSLTPYYRNWKANR